jgi:hypothetical protein
VKHAWDVALWANTQSQSVGLVVHLARLWPAEVVEQHVRLGAVHHPVVVRAVLSARVCLTRQRVAAQVCI